MESHLTDDTTGDIVVDSADEFVFFFHDSAACHTRDVDLQIHDYNAMYVFDCLLGIW